MNKTEQVIALISLSLCIYFLVLSTVPETVKKMTLISLPFCRIVAATHGHLCCWSKDTYPTLGRVNNRKKERQKKKERIAAILFFISNEDRDRLFGILVS